MNERRRTWAIAAAVGMFVAIFSVIAGFLLSDWLDDTPEPDGTFVLNEPGVFDEPLDVANADVIGRQVSSAVVFDADGNEHQLSELAGKPLVINVWFSQCIPCRRELRDFAIVHSEVGDRIEFVGLNPVDTVDTMQRFAADRGVTYTLWRDTTSELINDLGVVAFPTTLFVDADGTIVREVGELTADELRAELDDLFPVAATAASDEENR